MVLLDEVHTYDGTNGAQGRVPATGRWADADASRIRPNDRLGRF